MGFIMIKWIKERAAEKSTWFAILVFLGSLATMPVISVATVTAAFVNAALGALAGATTKNI